MSPAAADTPVGHSAYHSLLSWANKGRLLRLYPRFSPGSEAVKRSCAEMDARASGYPPPRAPVVAARSSRGALGCEDRPRGGRGLSMASHPTALRGGKRSLSDHRVFAAVVSTPRALGTSFGGRGQPGEDCEQVGRYRGPALRRCKPLLQKNFRRFGSLMHLRLVRVAR